MSKAKSGKAMLAAVITISFAKALLQKRFFKGIYSCSVPCSSAPGVDEHQFDVDCVVKQIT